VAQALVLVDRADASVRLGGGAHGGDSLVEDRLVVFDLSDQVDAGAGGLFEGFFGSEWRRRLAATPANAVPR
jgi:hypothetical protein